MLSSLPPLYPLSPHALYHPSAIAPPPPPSASPSNTTSPLPHTHRPTNPPSHLTALHIDELAIRARKAHIRRFGSNWLRPPGVSKTLQGMADERAEREEGEMVRAREMAVLEARGMVEAGVDGDGDGDGEVEGAGGGGEGGGERDLDLEVPDMDAEAEMGWSDADADEGEGEEGELEGAEQSLLVEGEGGEVDLDAEVPEGSYEHTDTEVEDESSDEGGGFGAARREGALGTNVGVGGVLGSSVFGSSPVGRRGGGRGLGRGREN